MELTKKVETAISLLKEFEPEAGYYLADSGGKDSTVIRQLAIMSGVKFDAHYSITTVDPPELVRFIKQHHPDTIREVPELNMWDLIVKKRLPPTRVVRFCCAKLKEDKGRARFVITGVRKAESFARSKRQDVEFDVYGSRGKAAIERRETFNLMNDNGEKRKLIESCTILGRHIINPIIDWSDSDVWDFIKRFNLPYCGLYDEGFKRLGCIGCPMQGRKGMLRDFKRWPTYYKKYLKAFDAMLAARLADGLETRWSNGIEVMTWWLGVTPEQMQEIHGGLTQCE